VREPVSANVALTRAVADAFRASLEPLAVDGIIVDLAAGLMAAAPDSARPADSRHVDHAAVDRARQLLDAERTRVVRSTELESLTGLSRYDLCRQFRFAFGTSPHRYLLRRGFADQAHFTRTFKTVFGLTPARYRALRHAASGRKSAGASMSSAASNSSAE
jgi:AraC-like DNA-binding protein